MWPRLIAWMEITNGFGIGAALDAGLAVALLAVAMGGLQFLFKFL